MKRLEDAPKELRDMFAKLWSEKQGKECLYPEDYAEQFFIAGFDVAMATAGMRHRRRIAEIMQTDDKLIAVSNDRQAFVWNENDMTWKPMPNLPQD